MGLRFRVEALGPFCVTIYGIQMDIIFWLCRSWIIKKKEKTFRLLENRYASICAIMYQSNDYLNTIDQKTLFKQLTCNVFLKINLLERSLNFRWIVMLFQINHVDCNNHAKQYVDSKVLSYMWVVNWFGSYKVIREIICRTKDHLNGEKWSFKKIVIQIVVKKFLCFHSHLHKCLCFHLHLHKNQQRATFKVQLSLMVFFNN